MFIFTLISQVWTSIAPKTWKTSRLQPVYKNKGSQTDPAMHRALMVNSTISKVLVTCLLDRLRYFYENIILHSQFGFRVDKSTTDAIYVARQLILKVPGQIYGCFIDLTAAYDHIDREILWQVLELRLGKTVLIDIFKKLYENTKAKIAGCDQEIDVEIGLRQGGPESCMLFNIYLDTVLRFAIHKFHQQIETPGISHKFNISNECTNRSQRARNPSNGTQRTTLINFADDILAVAKSKEELQIMVTILVETFKNFGLTLSSKKTETMSWNTNENVKIEESLISVENKPLKNVRKFKYLGHWMSDNLQKATSLGYQFGAAYQKWNEWKNVLTDQRIKLVTRVKFAESVIRSRLTYAVQTDRLKATQKATIDGVWARMLRKIIKNGFSKISENSHIPKYSNHDVLKICRTKSASTFCQIQHLKFLAHVARMNNDTLQKQWMFTSYPKTKCQWLPLANDLGIDPIQLRKTIFDKTKLNELLQVIPAPGI